METVFIPTEIDLKKWVKEAVSFWKSCWLCFVWCL